MWSKSHHIYIEYETCAISSSCVPTLYHSSLHATDPAWPCLVLAGCLAEDSEDPGSSMELCWKPVHSDGQQQIQLHLSLAVKPAVWTRGREGTGEKEWEACACECVCVWVRGGGGCIGGPLIRMSELHGGYVHGEERVRKTQRGGEREREKERGREWEREVGSVSSSWTSEQVWLYVSKAHESPRETQYKFGFISTLCIDLFRVFYGAFGPKKQSMVALVKMSVLSSLTSCFHFESKFIFSMQVLCVVDCLFFFLFPFSFHITGSRVQTVGTMPDSPADVKSQPRSTPPTMPPPPPAVSQATNRNASFTPTTSKSSKIRFLTEFPKIIWIWRIEPTSYSNNCSEMRGLVWSCSV